MTLGCQCMRCTRDAILRVRKRNGEVEWLCKDDAVDILGEKYRKSIKQEFNGGWEKTKETINYE